MKAQRYIKFSWLSFFFIPICLISFGNINEKLFPSSIDSNSLQIQQPIVLTLWLISIPILFSREGNSGKLKIGSLFYVVYIFYYCISAFWGSELYGVTKSIALVVTTLGAFLLASKYSTAQILGTTAKSLIALITLSTAVALALPNIGVHDSWMHAGQWSGVFQTKQDLGFASAFLILIVLVGCGTPSRWKNATVIAIALVTLLMSGSRGAGVVTLLSTFLYFFSRNRSLAKPLLSGCLFTTAAIGIASSIYFLVQNKPYFEIFGHEVNITNRTYIWQYALEQAREHLFFGFGLNSFWQLNIVYSNFISEFSWFLDNYHSGYVGIIVEGGIVGLCFFTTFLIKLIATSGNLLQQKKNSGAQEARLLLSIICFIFAVNLTESYFLRSTNIFQLIISYCVFRMEIIRRKPLQ